VAFGAAGPVAVAGGRDAPPPYSAPILLLGRTSFFRSGRAGVVCTARRAGQGRREPQAEATLDQAEHRASVLGAHGIAEFCALQACLGRSPQSTHAGHASPSTATAGGRGQGSLTGLPPAFLLHFSESNLGRLWRPLRTASQPVTLAGRELPQKQTATSGRSVSGAIRGGVIQLPPPRKPGQAKTHPRG
jgi:hypothetical protein